MNKYQESLKFFIKLANRVPLKFANDEFCERFDKNIVLIKELVDRATTKKVSYEGDGYDDKGELIYDTAICPTCERKFEVDYDEHSNYCPSCGQRLDWSDEE